MGMEWNGNEVEIKWNGNGMAMGMKWNKIRMEIGMRMKQNLKKQE